MQCEKCLKMNSKLCRCLFSTYFFAHLEMVFVNEYVLQPLKHHNTFAHVGCCFCFTFCFVCCCEIRHNEHDAYNK